MELIKRHNRVKMPLSSVFFEIFLYTLMVLLGCITVYPFINVLAISLNESNDTVKGGIYLLPRVWSFESYRQIFQLSGLVTAFRNSILRTLLGAATTTFLTTMLAFTLSRREFIARKLFSGMFVVTLYVSGGMIPGFLLIRNLGLIDSFWVYILPGLVATWSTFVVRSYIDTLPQSLQESAKIDGANDFVIFFKVIFPLCTPVLASIGLFAAVGQWNAWFDTYLYNPNNPELTTLQFEMMKILMSTEALRNLASSGNQNDLELMSKLVSPESMRMAITVVATLPILLVYPFVQKYFVKGLTLGSVKG